MIALSDGVIVPRKLRDISPNDDTSLFPPHPTPVHGEDPGPQGNVVAVLPLQFQPDAKGTIVGARVGADAVGAAVKGAAVGAGLGFEGQLVIPSLNAHRALASDC